MYIRGRYIYICFFIYIAHCIIDHGMAKLTLREKVFRLHRAFKFQVLRSQRVNDNLRRSSPPRLNPLSTELFEDFYAHGTDLICRYMD
ncbi:hypothetical protein ANTRET_LOCUS4036 [Anthophora retusa]